MLQFSIHSQIYAMQQHNLTVVKGSTVMKYLKNRFHTLIIKTIYPMLSLSIVLNCIYIMRTETPFFRYHSWINDCYNNITFGCLLYTIFALFYLACYTCQCPKHPKRRRYLHTTLCNKFICYCKSTSTECGHPADCKLFYTATAVFFSGLLLSVIYAKILSFLMEKLYI